MDIKTIKDIHNEIRNFPKELIKSACITGSSMLVYDDIDITSWDSEPDIDIFCYNPSSYVALITYINYATSWKLGADSTGKSASEETMKFGWTTGQRWSWGSWQLVTIKFQHQDGITINVSCRKNCESAAEVIGNFDMSIIMIAEDLYSNQIVDMRGPDIYSAKVNPFKRISHSKWSIDRWLRQIDRVEKYSARGFDTTAMSKFYIALLEDAIEYTLLFTQSEETEQLRDGYKEQLERLLSIQEAEEAEALEAPDGIQL